MLALGVLGALEHTPAADVIVQVARDQSREPDLRWEAARQLLALDPLLGFKLLSSMSECESDTLSAPAASLRQELLSAYPQLAEREAA